MIKHASSSSSELVPTLPGAFERKLRDKIPPEVCKKAGEAVEKWSREVFPNMQTSDTIDILDENFLADYGLVTPQFTNGMANIR